MSAFPIPLPDALQQQIGAAEWHEDHLGMSGARVFRIVSATETLFLKTVTGDAVRELADEAARIAWLNGRLPVPEIRYAGHEDETYYLLMTEVPGRDASKKPLPPDQLTRLLAEGIKAIHALDITDCPFDHRLEKRLELVRARLDAGLITFGEEGQNQSAYDQFAELLKTRPASEDLVFTHGDYCLPNILINPDTGQINGYIDLGRAGVADRHQDIALCARSLAYNLSEEWVPLLYETYGPELIDPAKIEYYKLLDELF
jgi:aminoglycoside 3'-phosphotransferase-2